MGNWIDELDEDTKEYDRIVRAGAKKYDDELYQDEDEEEEGEEDED